MSRSFATFSGAVNQELKHEDSEWMGGYITALSAAQGQADMSVQNAAVDEYFRKNFRKLSVAQAMHIIKPLSYTEGEHGALADSFWMWETLDEAVRGEIDTMPLEDVWAVHQAMGLKMSEDLMDVCEIRFYNTKESPMPNGTNIIVDGKFTHVGSETAEYKHSMENAHHH